MGFVSGDFCDDNSVLDQALAWGRQPATHYIFNVDRNLRRQLLLLCHVEELYAQSRYDSLLAT